MTQSESHTSLHNSDEDGDRIDETTAADSKRAWQTSIRGKQLGDFLIRQEIGRGGMGVVYRATELGLGREVALKVLPKTGQLSRLDVERFLVEARAAAKLDHDHIVPVYHVGEDDGIRYYAMKLIEGQNLASLVRTAKAAVQQPSGGPKQHDTDHRAATTRRLSDDSSRKNRSQVDLSGESFAASMTSGNSKSTIRLAKSIATLGSQIAEALHHAHLQGVIHRDIKPSNLLLDPDSRVWIADFGLAQLQNSTSLTRTGDIIGTLHYMSPEQASGRRAFVDNRTDIYSLGVTLYELATLQRACRGRTTPEILREITFERPTPVRKINPRLPRDFETIITKATERNPADRYQTADDMAVDLRRFIRGESPIATPPSKLKRARDWLSDRPRFVAAIAASAIFVLISLSAFAWTLNSRLAVSEGERWRAESALALSQEHNNPGLALMNALNSAQHTPGFAADQAILAALDRLRETRRIPLGDTKPGKLVFSQDGKRLLKCVDMQFHRDGLGKVILFDVVSGERLGQIVHELPVFSAAFSPINNVLLTSGTTAPSKREVQPDYSDAPVLAWNLDALAEEPRVLRNTRACRLKNSAFSPDGSRAVLPSSDSNDAIVFETGDWSKESMRLRGHTAPVIEAAYSRNGNWIGTLSEDGTIRLWDKAGTNIQTFDFDDRQLPYTVDIAFSRDSSEFKVSSYGGTQTYSLDGPAEGRYVRQKSVQFMHRRSDLLAKSFLNDSILVYGSQSQSAMAECKSDEPLGDFVSVGKDEHIAAVVQRSPNIKIFRSYDGKLIDECRGHTDWIRDIRARPNSNEFATISFDDTLRFWNVESNIESRTVVDSYLKLSDHALDFSEDGHKAILSTVKQERSLTFGFQEELRLKTDAPGAVECILEDGRIFIEEPKVLKVLDPDTLRVDAILDLPTESVAEAIPLAGGNSVLFVTDSRQLLKWKLEPHQLTRLSNIGQSIVDFVMHKPSGHIFAGTQNGELLRIDPLRESLELIDTLGPAILHLDFNDEWSRLLITTEEGRRSIWDLAQSKSVAVVSAESANLLRSWFMGDNQLLAAGFGRNNGSFELWDWEKNSRIAQMEIASVRDVQISPARDRIAVASATEGVQLWNPTSDESQQLTEHRNVERIMFLDDQRLMLTVRKRSSEATQTEEHGTAVQLSVLVWDNNLDKVAFEQPVNFNPTQIQANSLQKLVSVSGTTYGAEVVKFLDSASDLQTTFGHTRRLILSAFTNSQATSAVTVSEDGQILVHDLERESRKPMPPHTYRITAAALSPDRAYLLTSDESGLLRQFATKDGELVRELAPPEDGLSAGKHLIESNSTYVASMYGDRMLSLWDLRSGKHNVQKFDKPIQHLSVAPNSPEVFVLLGDRRLMVSPSRELDGAYARQNKANAYIVDMLSAEKTKLEVEEPIVLGELLSDQRSLACLTRHGTILVVDKRTGNTRQVIRGPSRFLTLLTNDQEGETLYALTDRTVEGWNWKSGHQVFGMRIDSTSIRATSIPWSVEHPQSDWRMLFSGNKVVKVPINPARYAHDVAPWTSHAN